MTYDRRNEDNGAAERGGAARRRRLRSAYFRVTTLNAASSPVIQENCREADAVAFRD